MLTSHVELQQAKKTENTVSNGNVIIDGNAARIYATIFYH
jgi:hypothetical protein